MCKALSASAQKVQDALQALGFPYKVTELSQTTRSASEAARAIGCQVGQIVKSIVFKGKRTEKPILVIASGSNRVNEKTIAELVSEPIELADADFVRQRTGFAIGGVPPIGHAEPLQIFIDQDLLQYDEIWAAAGNANAVFRLTPADIIAMTGGRVLCIQ